MSETLIGTIPEEWIGATLGELCTSGGGNIQTGPFGSQLHASDYVPIGVPSVMPQNIGDNIIIEDNIARITTADAERLSRYLLQTGDIVYSRRGDVERRALVQPEQEGWLCGTGCLRVRLGSSADSRFISYFLGHPEVRAWIVRHAIGATMANLNTEILSAVPIILPPRGVQEAIAAVLGVLDGKIAVNDRIAATARELAQSRFKAAVDTGQSQTIRVNEITGFLNRGVTPRYTDDPAQLLVLNQKCIRNGRVQFDAARRTTRDRVATQKLLQRGDVLVNSTGFGTLGRVARWAHDQECTVDSHVTIVRFDSAKVDPVCAGFAILAAQPEIEALGEGSTGQTELSRIRLGAARLTVPDRAVSAELRPKLSALEAKGDAALHESITLAELRDTLLPKLMSGKIRIRDAEKIAEDAMPHSLILIMAPLFHDHGLFPVIFAVNNP